MITSQKPKAMPMTTKMYLSFRPIPSTDQIASVTAIENCMAELRSWMIFNMLIVSDSKAGFLIVWIKQQLEHVMMTSSNVNIFRITGPLCGEFTGQRWIPLTKASDAELLCFLWSAPE